jgi:LysM repeat protein
LFAVSGICAIVCSFFSGLPDHLIQCNPFLTLNKQFCCQAFIQCIREDTTGSGIMEVRNMKSRRLGSAVIVGIVLLASACSSSKPKEADGTEVIPPAADAATDAIPQPEVENPLAANPTEPAVAPPEVTPTPDPTPASDPSTPSAVHQEEDYAVQSGDTLMKIAFDVYGDVYQWKNIYEANKDKISDPNSIPKGLVLKLEKPTTPVSVERNGQKYLIKKGDTLGKISDALYGTTDHWKKLWEHNKQLIHDPNKIFSGFYLYYLANANDMNAAANQEGAAPSSSTPNASSSATEPETKNAAPLAPPSMSPPPMPAPGALTNDGQSGTLDPVPQSQNGLPGADSAGSVDAPAPTDGTVPPPPPSE